MFGKGSRKCMLTHKYTFLMTIMLTFKSLICWFCRWLIFGENFYLAGINNNRNSNFVCVKVSFECYFSKGVETTGTCCGIHFSVLALIVFLLTLMCRSTWFITDFWKLLDMKSWWIWLICEKDSLLRFIGAWLNVPSVEEAGLTRFCDNFTESGQYMMSVLNYWELNCRFHSLLFDDNLHLNYPTKTAKIHPNSHFISQLIFW